MPAEVLDRALVTQRRWRIDALAADPPGYVTDLLGSQPAERVGQLRWRTGLTLVEDLRAEYHLVGDPEGVTAWERAVGVSPDALEGAGHAPALRQLAEIRRDLALIDRPAPVARTERVQERHRRPGPVVMPTRRARGRSR